MTDLELVRNIKEDKNVEESIVSLLSLHAPLITKISSKFIKPLNDSGSSIEDIMGEKEFIIYKAASQFKEEKKVKFSSYLGSFVRWYCLNRINRSDDWKHCLEIPLDNIPQPTANDDLLDYLKDQLSRIEDERIRTVFELRYFSGPKVMTFTSIGKIMGVSGQSTNNWLKKGLKLLKSRAASNYHV